MADHKRCECRFEKCSFCGEEFAVEIYHHDGFVWSNDFSVDQRLACNVLVCTRCGRVSLLDPKVVDDD